MCTPDLSFYPMLLVLLAALIGPIHKASLQAISALVWALLLGQSLQVSDLSRALPTLQAASARQGMRRVRRGLDRSPLMSACLSPHLIRVVLRLVPDDPLVLVLDSTRCRHWEIFTLGVVFEGRVLPIAWCLLPYPWPKRQFTPTVVGLLERTLICWPIDRPLHLVADRGFPSLKLFGCLEAWRSRLPSGHLGYTIRLRAGDWVCLTNTLSEAKSVKLADLAQSLAISTDSSGADKWTSRPASYCHRRHQSPTALLVLGHSAPIYPPHQRGPADAARRAARNKRRRAHLLSKAQPKSPATDGLWMLLTSCQTIAEARAFYALRFRTEGMYRDLKEWGLEGVAAHETDKRHLDGLIGVAALGYFVQAALGQAVKGAVVGCTEASVQACQRQRQWCTTDRLSVFWRGRQVLQDRTFDWRPWLKVSLTDLTQALAEPPLSHAEHPHAQEPPKHAAPSASALRRAKEAA